MSEKKGLNDWRDDSVRIAVAHGFKDASIGEDIALMHSELSEALEDHRESKAPDTAWYEEKVPAFDESGKPILVDGKHATVSIRHTSPYPMKADGTPDTDHPYKPCGIPSELADVIIRALHFAGKHKIDIENAVREKTHFNECRPYLHGGKVL